MRKILVVLLITGVFTINAQNKFPSTGNVGIGTITPEDALEVRGSFASYGYLKVFNINDKTKRRLTLNMGEDGRAYIYNVEKSTGTMFPLNVGGTMNFSTGVTILPNGKVGIGNASPATLLDVSDNTSGAGETTLTVYKRYTGTSALREAKIRMGGAAYDDKTFEINVSSANAWYNNPDMRFYRADNPEKDDFVIHNSGRVGIGTSNPQYKLTVEGSIGAKQIIVKDNLYAADFKITSTDKWADYVFEEDYNLPTLDEVEDFIKENGHLPEIPTTESVNNQGYGLAEMNALLLKKIEELTLYTIEMNKVNKDLNERLSRLENN